MYEPELEIPLDLFIGLLCEYKPAGEGETGIFELQFDYNYGRVPTNQMDWITPDGITMYNASDLLFPLVESDWGLITHFGLWLTEKGDECICVGDLHNSKNIRRSNRVCFRVKTIDVEIAHLAQEYEHYKFGGEQNV